MLDCGAGPLAPAHPFGLLPILSGVLLGTTFPAFGADDATDAPPPRLRLETVLESLSRPPALPDAPSSSAPATNSPEASSAKVARLRLALALPSGNGAPAAPPTAPFAVPSAPASPPASPRPQERRTGTDAPFMPARTEGRDESTGKAGYNRNATSSDGDTKPARDATPPSKQLASTASASGSEKTASGAAARAPSGGLNAEVVGGEEFLPADELDLLPPGGTRPKPGQGAPGSQLAASSPTRKWGVAPIRWGGSLSAGFRRNQSENSDSTMNQVYEARLRANSYIMQPYIALVSGDASLTMVRDQSGSSSAASNNLTGTSITGNGILSVFPQSRFPFQASLGVSDSRSDGSFADTNTRRARLALRQDYRPQRGNWNASGRYDRSQLTGSFGKDIVDRVSASYSTNYNDHSLSAEGSFASNRSADLTSDDFYAMANHGYRLDETTSVSTSASIAGQKYSLSSDSLDSSGDAQSAQVFSYLSWVPTDSPWQGTANLRYFQNRSTFGGTTFENRNMGGSASLTYRANQNLSAFGTFGVNSDNDGNLGTNQSLGLNYSGDPLTFGNYYYNWYGSTSVSNSTSSQVDAQRSVSASLGHSLQRNWQTGEQTTISGSLNQTVSNNRSMGLSSSSSTSLSHSASVSLQATPSDNLSGYISGSLSDNRTMGDNPSAFQMLNVQVNGRWRTSAYSELSANLTWQLSRQQSESQTETVVIDEFGRPVVVDNKSLSRTSNLSGNLGYSHGRLLGVRGLRYSLDFRANTNRDQSRIRGNPDALRAPDQAAWDLDQRLLYRIGRLDTELQFRIAEINDTRNSLIYFRVSRAFGAF